jgi:RNA polymerase primary sigma factor
MAREPSQAVAEQPEADDTVDALQLFLRRASRYPLLSSEQELELSRRIERGDLAAKERLVNHNLRLVVSIARRFQGVSELTLLDLVQEGVVGLIRAAEKFDWRKGFRFSTYATLWIRQAIQRGMATHGRTIRLPVNVAQRERKVSAAARRLEVQLGRRPTAQEIADAAGLEAEEVTALRDAARTLTSLDQVVTADSETTLGELLPSDEPAVEEAVETRIRRETVRRTVDDLPSPERDVIKLRFGLAADRTPLPHAQIGRQLALGTAQVRAIEREALALLARRGALAALADAA